MSDCETLVGDNDNSLILEQVKSILDIQRKLLWEAQVTRRAGEVTRLASVAPIMDEVQAFADGRQLGFLESVRELSGSSRSFARFGDGEFKLMLRPEYKLKFQSNSPALASQLKEVLQSGSDSQLLVGFPNVYRDVHWSGVWADTWGQLKRIMSSSGLFGNSHVSRPVFFQLCGDEGVDAWRSVWAGKRVTVITGKDSRFELVPALFSSAAEVVFMDSVPVEAFDDIPRIVDLVSKSDHEIVLVSLGPAGTILAKRLAEIGVRSIDIGHISDSYLNVFEGGAWPESKVVSRAL